MANERSFPKSIESITLIETSASGDRGAVTFYERKNRGSRNLRPLERLVRRVAQAQQTMVNEFLNRHEESKKEGGDDWLRDMGNNVFKAVNKARKKLMPKDMNLY